MRKTKLLALAGIVFLLLLSYAGTAQADSNSGQIKRLYGQTRYDTSVQIADALYSGTVQNVVVASGNGYADALSASVLANKLQAPIILVNDTLDDSGQALNYIQAHLASGGNIYIVGGEGAVPSVIAQKLSGLGYAVNRLGGQDRYETDTLVANELKVPLNTPVVLAGGDDFPDVLGVSSLAASKGWPILLTDSNGLAPTVQTFITNDQPSQIYLVGGVGILSPQIKKTVQGLVPSATITRLAGADRFATLSKTLDTFFPDPSQIFVADGYDYPDALSGSPLAASQNAPILLINPNSKLLPPEIMTYLQLLNAAGVQPQITALGGTGAVPDILLQAMAKVLGESTTTQATGTATQTDVITGTIQQTGSNNSLVTINLSNPSVYAGATQYQVLINGNAISPTATIGAATTVYPAQSSGATVQVKFYNANFVQVGSVANVVLSGSGATTQTDVITGTIQQTSSSSSTVMINLSNPSVYAGATQYQVLINGYVASSLTALNTASTVYPAQYSGSTVQVQFYNASGTQLGSVANVVLSGTGTTTPTDVVTGTIQQTTSTSSTIMINLSNPSLYAGASQYQILINGSAVSGLTALNTATTVYPAQYSGNSVQVRFYNANGTQLGSMANVVLTGTGTTTQTDVITGTIQATNSTSSTIMINLSNPSLYAGASQYQILINGSAVSYLTPVNTATTVTSIQSSGNTVQVEFYNAIGTQVGSIANVVLSGAVDLVTGTIQQTYSNSSVLLISLSNPVTYAGASQYQILVNGGAVSSLTAVNTATTIYLAEYSGNTVQVRFYNANGIQVGAIANVVLTGTGTTTQTDAVTGTIQQTYSNYSTVLISLSNPVTYAGTTQYQVLINGSAVSGLTALNTATTVYPAQYSGNTVQVRFYNAGGTQLGAIANVVLTGTGTTGQTDAVTGTIQQSYSNYSSVVISLSNPVTYAGATQYLILINGSAVSSLTPINTATTVYPVEYSGNTVQVKFYNANGTQLGAVANVVLNGSTNQTDSVTGTIQQTTSNSSVVMISLSNPLTYSGATQYIILINGSAVSGLTALNTATTVYPAQYSGNTVQVKFYNSSGTQLGAVANVVLNGTTNQTDIVTGTIQQTTSGSSTVIISLSNPSTYSGATQYQVLINGSAVSYVTALNSATTVYPAQYSGNTVQVKFLNASSTQIGALANVVLH